MIETQEKQVTVKKTVAIVCDKCKKRFEVDDKEKWNTDFEIQEFHHIRIHGGYGSVFGDGNEIECDLCQDCLFSMIKDCYRDVTPIWEEDEDEETQEKPKEVPTPPS